MFKRVTVAVAVLAALAGCASPDMYRQYAEGQAKIEVAKYTAQAEKYKAIAQIAGTGDATAKVAAVVAMAMGDTGSGGSGTGGSAQLQAPKDPSDTAIQWASILVPATVQGFGIKANRDVAIRQSDNSTTLGIRQSDNAASVQISTNQTMQGISLGIANLIPQTISALPSAPPPSNTTTTTTTTNTTTTNTNTTNNYSVPPVPAAP